MEQVAKRLLDLVEVRQNSGLDNDEQVTYTSSLSATYPICDSHPKKHLVLRVTACHHSLP